MPITDGADIGFGVAITFQSGLFAEIIELNGEGISRKSVPFIHMALTNGYIRKLPSDVRDPGKWRVKVFFETQRLAAYKTAMTAALETVTVTYAIPVGGTTAGTIAASGFATNFSQAVPVEDGMTAEFDLELTAEPTYTSAT